jgi:Tfp pilus assembly protein PilF
MNFMSRITCILLLCAVVGGCATSKKTRQDASSHYQMGMSYLKEQNYTGALNELTEADRLTPDDPDILLGLGMAYYYKKQYHTAEDRYLKAIKYRDNFSLARNNLGVAYLEMKRWDDAIVQFTIVNGDLFFDDQESAGINLGLAYLGKGDIAAAMTVLRRQIAANPQNPVAHLNLGRAYFADGRYNLAIGEYQEAIRLSPDYPPTHYYLALAFLKAQKNDEARKSFREVVRLTPFSEFGQIAKEQLDALK